ncbi:MAG TPA: ATP-binding cassette domain-containing protein [Thermodesulfobacteriota bacterium]|nr:ATP-binding cassette domain-containing protein [Thermodesulfobacteriota bacterium]
MIEVKNLSKKFGNIVAVNGVSFTVNKGEVVGLLGPNGAGKTTTMRIVTCYLPATSGTALVAGFDVFENSLEVRKRVGYLPENAPLYLDMPVLDFLQFISAIRGIPKQETKSRIRKMVEVCGLESVINRDIGELSKGFRQRVGLAQSLIHDPEILILDEPTVGLDPTQIIEIRELIKEIGKEKTVILSSHILPEVSATCNRIIIIHKGEIVGSGTPDEMAQSSKKSEIIHITIKGPLEDIQRQLNGIPEVKEFKVASRDDGVNSFEIKSELGVDLSEKLFFMVVNNRWILTELKKETVNLEEIFLKLTTEENSPL